MKTKEELKWRLSKLPTPNEVSELVKDKIITQEEARQILFSKETIEEKTVEDLKEEIKFLKQLVEKLSSNNSTKIIEVIREVQKPYQGGIWYRPYYEWTCGGSSNVTLCSGTGGTTSGTSLMTNFSSIN